MSLSCLWFWFHFCHGRAVWRLVCWWILDPLSIFMTVFAYYQCKLKHRFLCVSPPEKGYGYFYGRWWTRQKAVIQRKRFLAIARGWLLKQTIYQRSRPWESKESSMETMGKEGDAKKEKSPFRKEACYFFMSTFTFQQLLLVFQLLFVLSSWPVLTLHLFSFLSLLAFCLSRFVFFLAECVFYTAACL